MFNLIPILVSLFILEILLSLDNALINAALANKFPKKERNHLIRIGTLLAIAFRVIALVLMSLILKNIWMKFFCGLYLIAIAIKHIGRPTDRNGHLIKETDSMRTALLQIIIVDRVFSITNVLAVASFREQIQVIIAIIIFGMVSIAVGAPLFSKVLHRYKGLYPATFSIVLFLGITMCIETFPRFTIENWTKLLLITVIIVSTIMYEHSHHARKILGPTLLTIQKLLAYPVDLYYSCKSFLTHTQKKSSV